MSAPEWLTEPLAITLLRELGLPVADTYLRDQRRKGGGPPHRYFGVHILYEAAAIPVWVRDEALKPTTWSRHTKPGETPLKRGDAKPRRLAPAEDLHTE